MQRAAVSILLLLSGVAYASDEPVAAVLQGDGTVYVNGQHVMLGRESAGGIPSTAVMPGDIVQTTGDGAAHVNAAGLGATVGANTVMRFQTAGMALDQGTLTVGTGKASSVFARDFKITPVSTSWTQFNVSRSSGVIQILALKNDVTVSCETGKPITVKEGQQVSRPDAANCGLAAKGTGAPEAIKGPILASPAAEKVGLAVGGSIAAWAIFQADDPVSPSAP